MTYLGTEQSITRAASVSDHNTIREIQRRAFGVEDEAQLWDHLAANDPNLSPECVRLALVDNKPVACTVVLPRKVYTRVGVATGAVVTLVGCLPEHQNKGYGGATVRDALRFMQQNGMDVAVLLGHPAYYPRFGFAPVIPRSSVLATCESCIFEGAADFRPATRGDYAFMAQLFAESLAYPAGPVRSDAVWLWKPRNESRLKVLVAGAKEGYACVNTGSEDSTLAVPEVACVPGKERAVLAGLARVAQDSGMAKMRISLPPDAPIARLAQIAGGEVLRRPAAAGMAAVLNWNSVLPQGYGVAGNILLHNQAEVLRCDTRELTQLALGYYDIDDLLLIPGVSVTRAAVGQLRADFPKLHPKWFLEPFWS